jgi:hypothetical protein
MGAGLREVGRILLCTLFELIDAVVAPRRSGLMQLNAN